MPPAAAAKPTPRRRTRKRKRRAASSSVSSSSSSDSDSDEETTPSPKKALPRATKIASSSEDSSSDSDSSDPSSSSSSDEETRPADRGRPTAIAEKKTPATRKYSPSPSPPPAEIPSFLPAVGEEKEKKKQAMKAQFRKFWLTAVADGFKDDLEEIRKEPNLNTSRLALLIDSLASGADVFTSQKDGGAGDIQTLLG